MFCEQCGARNEDWSHFCQECGAVQTDAGIHERPVSSDTVRSEGVMPKLSPAIFGIILVLFLLPWLNVSCGQQEIASFSGIELLTGKTSYPAEVNDAVRQWSKQSLGSLFVFLTLVFAALGLFLGFVRGRDSTGNTIGVSICGALSMVFMSATSHSFVAKQAGGVLAVGNKAGFYLALMLFLVAAVLNYYQRIVSKDKPGGSVAVDTCRYCIQCGSRNSSDNLFCVDCGERLL